MFNKPALGAYIVKIATDFSSTALPTNIQPPKNQSYDSTVIHAFLQSSSDVPIGKPDIVVAEDSPHLGVQGNGNLCGGSAGRNLVSMFCTRNQLYVNFGVKLTPLFVKYTIS
jgi:hypothetical protein